MKSLSATSPGTTVRKMSNQRVEKHWFASVLRDLMAEKKVSVADLAEAVDLDESVIEFALDGVQTPRLRTCEKILRYFGHEIEVMLCKK